MIQVGDWVEYQGQQCPVVKIRDANSFVIEFDGGWSIRENDVPANYIAQKKDEYKFAHKSEIKKMTPQDIQKMLNAITRPTIKIGDRVVVTDTNIGLSGKMYIGNTGTVKRTDGGSPVYKYKVDIDGTGVSIWCSVVPSTSASPRLTAADLQVGDFITTTDVQGNNLNNWTIDNIPRKYIEHGYTIVDVPIYQENGCEIIYIDQARQLAVIRVFTTQAGDKGNKYVQLAVNINNMTKKKTTPKPKTKFDLKELDKLVVSDLVMSEIKAVLKQHDHSKKMFEEWGLGEVIQYGRGMTFLFYGPPGTGKTWAANCMAKVFGKELMSIGAAEIQTSEPGGANRNIQQAFAEAKKSGKVLLLDECDSLITSRNDVGMILGGEINTLLTEIEKYEGVVILATNRIENLDEALERRISLIVEFPEPDYEQRVKIWEVLLPKKLPLAKAITAKKLGEYKLTGGQIKNVLLASARLALAADSDKVEVAHVEAAVDRIIKSKSLMGTASRYRQIAVREDFKKGH